MLFRSNSAVSLHVNFGDLFASERSSREGYTEIFAAQLATPLRVDLLVAKNACFAFQSQFFKTFSVFPQTFYDFSLSLSTETHPNTPCHSLQTPFLHLFTSKSSRKRYGFLFPHLISRVLSFIFMNIYVGVLIFFFCYGFVSFFFWDCPCLDC